MVLVRDFSSMLVSARVPSSNTIQLVRVCRGYIDNILLLRILNCLDRY